MNENKIPSDVVKMIEEEAAKYSKEVWGSQDSAQDFITNTRKGKRSYEEFACGATFVYQTFAEPLKEENKNLKDCIKIMTDEIGLPLNWSLV